MLFQSHLVTSTLPPKPVSKALIIGAGRGEGEGESRAKIHDVTYDQYTSPIVTFLGLGIQNSETALQALPRPLSPTLPQLESSLPADYCHHR